MEKKTNNEAGRGNTFTKKIGKTIYKVTVHFSKILNSFILGLDKTDTKGIVYVESGFIIR